MKYRGVIISGLPRSGKTTICKMIEREYGWPMLYLGQMVRDKYNLEVPDGSTTFEKWYSGCSVEFLRQINEEARKRMMQEELTVDSRLTPLYARGTKYCGFFVTASRDVRIARTQLSHPEATVAELTIDVLSRELEELKKGLLLYNRNFQDPELYDYILDTSKMTIEQEFEFVRRALGKPNR